MQASCASSAESASSEYVKYSRYGHQLAIAVPNGIGCVPFSRPRATHCPTPMLADGRWRSFSGHVPCKACAERYWDAALFHRPPPSLVAPSPEAYAPHATPSPCSASTPPSQTASRDARTPADAPAPFGSSSARFISPAVNAFRCTIPPHRPGTIKGMQLFSTTYLSPRSPLLPREEEKSDAFPF